MTSGLVPSTSVCLLLPYHQSPTRELLIPLHSVYRVVAGLSGQTRSSGPRLVRGVPRSPCRTDAVCRRRPANRCHVQVFRATTRDYYLDGIRKENELYLCCVKLIKKFRFCDILKCSTSNLKYFNVAECDCFCFTPLLHCLFLPQCLLHNAFVLSSQALLLNVFTLPCIGASHIR